MMSHVSCRMRDVVFITITCTIFVVTVIAALSLVLTMPDNNNEICLNINGNSNAPTCRETSSLLHTYLSEHVQRNHITRVKTTQKEMTEYIERDDDLVSLKPAAKLTGSAIQLGDTGLGNETVNWNSDTSDAYPSDYRTRGVWYKNGRLGVPVSGTYFIYSALGFYKVHVAATNASAEKTPMIHAMYKYNIIHGKEVAIASFTQSQYIGSSSGLSYYSSYISTLVDLHSGDEILVKTNNIALLRYPEDSYFGLCLI